jgi:flagellar assembly protein FliH
MATAKKFKRTLHLPRELSGVSVARSGPAPLAVAEAEARVEAAREETRARVEAFCDRQIHETREEMLVLQNEVFGKLDQEFDALKRQLREGLPELVIALTERVLGQIELDRDALRQMVFNLLDEIAPDTAEVRLLLHPRDKELVEGLDAELATRYSSLEVVGEPSLERGDCQVRTRFGLVDARLQTKLKRVSEEVGR